MAAANQPTETFSPPPGAESVDKTEKDPEHPAGAAGPVASALPAPPAQVAGYRMLRKLGAGTYGVVWLAEEEKTGIRAAIKFFHHGAGDEWQLLQAEVKQLAALHSDPGIVELLDVGLDTDPPYYIMRYAEGGSLAQRLDQGPVPLTEALALFRRVTEALAYVHVKGIRHCDLKPGNILLDARGRALVADFGQAHLSTDASPTLGTFFYMAPEQASLARQIPDARWDVYGLGALLYAMLTGKPPRADSTLRSRLQSTAHLTTRLQLYRDELGQAPRPTAHRRVKGMDKALAALIEACLAIDPDRRPRDAGEVLALLARRERRRQQWPVLVSAVLAPLVLVLLMSGVLALVFQDARANVEDAEREHALRVGRHNQFIAEMMAEDVRLKVAERSRLLELWTKNPELVQLTAESGAGVSPRAYTWLLGCFTESGRRLAVGKTQARLNEENNKELWDYMSIVNADGYILAMIGSKAEDRPEVKPISFRWRDWFHGEEDQPQDYAGKIVTKTYVSEPYSSTLGMLMFTITTPIRDRHGKVVGLLTMSLTVERIAHWFDELKRRKITAVLVNKRGRYLYHADPSKIQMPPTIPPGTTAQSHSPGPPRPAHQLPMHHDLFEQHHCGIVQTPFADPLDGRHYLASYAPVDPDEHIPWGVVIQMEHESTPVGIEELKQTFWKASLVSVAVIGVLLPLLWVWVLQRLRRQEDLVQM
jgi:hypothetical protein